MSLTANGYTRTVKSADPARQAELDARVERQAQASQALANAHAYYNMNNEPSLSEQADYGCLKSRIMGGDLNAIDTWLDTQVEE